MFLKQMQIPQTIISNSFSENTKLFNLLYSYTFDIDTDRPRSQNIKNIISFKRSKEVLKTKVKVLVVCKKLSINWSRLARKAVLGFPLTSDISMSTSLLIETFKITVWSRHLKVQSIKVIVNFSESFFIKGKVKFTTNKQLIDCVAKAKENTNWF